MATIDGVNGRVNQQLVLRLVVVAMAQLKRDHPELALTAIDEALGPARGGASWGGDTRRYLEMIS